MSLIIFNSFNIYKKYVVLLLSKSVMRLLQLTPILNQRFDVKRIYPFIYCTIEKTSLQCIVAGRRSLDRLVKLLHRMEVQNLFGKRTKKHQIFFNGICIPKFTLTVVREWWWCTGVSSNRYRVIIWEC